jgi:hypothetical protein
LLGAVVRFWLEDFEGVLWRPVWLEDVLQRPVLTDLLQKCCFRRAALGSVITEELLLQKV